MKTFKKFKKVWHFRVGPFWLGIEVGFFRPVPEVNTLYIEVSYGKDT